MLGNISKSKFAIKWSIKWKLMAIMTILMLSLVTILTYIQISSQKKMLENELNKRITLMKENLRERGKSFIANLSDQVENNIASFNFSGAIEAVKVRAKNNRDIRYAVLMDSSGQVFIHTLNLNPGQSKLTERDARALKHKNVVVGEYQKGNESVIEIVNSIQISTEPWGVLRLVYTLEHLDREIEDSRQQIGYDIKQMIYNSVLTSLGFMGICFIIVVILSTRFSKPLIHLTHVARKLSIGDFSISSDIRIRSKDEVGVLAETFIEMSNELKDSYRKLEEYNRTLEQKVEKRTEELNKTLEVVEETNEKITDSIRYAKMIQRSLLPNPGSIKSFLPDSFFIWKPRDIVGGDFIFTDSFKEGFVIAVIDCTGHGVPGAFITMIATFGLRKITRDEGCHDPAEILKRLNFIIKTSLKQDTEYAQSDDGLDAAVCFVSGQSSVVSGQLSVVSGQLSVVSGQSSVVSGQSSVVSGQSSVVSGQSSVVSGQPSVVSRQLSVVSGQSSVTTDNRQPTTDNRQPTTDNRQPTTDNRQLIFAGAKLPLIYIHNDEINVIKGNRQSIGYKKSKLNFDFTNHVINVREGMSFYMASDGFPDQLGEKTDRRFGSKRFKNLLKESCDNPFEKQRDIILEAFDEYKGKSERQDDVTVVGFGFK
ncbi:SpoIIE family protein phosphatase [Desulfobacterales bacterium HSG2]|nr:SpoIIE family protein phosphatase [Desulfobacterales bacterium HSG2]